jgi:hypothetical protein
MKPKEQIPRLQIACHFLDSGAFSLRRDVAAYLQAHPGKELPDFYHSPEFRHYLDCYGRFVRYYSKAIDYYANVDVIGHPELSWRNLRYLEEHHGLHPVPVIHARTDLKWLEKHLDRKYPILAIGGLVGTSRHPEVLRWLNEFFRIVCPGPDHLPRVRLHAFGMTSGPLMFRYPFWSADATNILKLALFGKIIMPYPRSTGEAWNYAQEARVIALSDKVRSHKFNVHYRSVRPNKQRWVRDWLDYINKSGFFSMPLIWKMPVNRDCFAANFFFYEELCRQLPLWPWPYEGVRYRSDLHSLPESTLPPPDNSQERTRIFISGSDIMDRYNLTPLGVKAINRMMTYYDSYCRKDGVETELWNVYQDRGGRRPRLQQPPRPTHYKRAAVRRAPGMNRWGKRIPVGRLAFWKGEEL